jgi:hypothetical protein
MRRVSAGKRIELTQRDFELFTVLSRYRYLRSNFLFAFLGGKSETRFKERLGHLYHEGRYINRPQQQWQFGNSRYAPVVYELDVEGERALRLVERWEATNPGLRNVRAGAQRQFLHQLMICECTASIELATKRHPGLRFISSRDILAKAPAEIRELDNPFEMPVAIPSTLLRSERTADAMTAIIPDELFGLEFIGEGRKSYRFFALEVDRGTMPVKRSDLRQSSYLRKILAYRQIAAQSVYKSHLGLPNFVVLNVALTEERMRSIMSAVAGVAHEGRSKLFLFKIVGSVAGIGKAEPIPHLLTEPWLRVGHDPVRLTG